MSTCVRALAIAATFATLIAGPAVANGPNVIPNGTFDALTFTHRKECARWVADAKREETRQRRVQQALPELAGPRWRQGELDRLMVGVEQQTQGVADDRFAAFVHLGAGRAAEAHAQTADARVVPGLVGHLGAARSEP